MPRPSCSHHHHLHWLHPPQGGDTIAAAVLPKWAPRWDQKLAGGGVAGGDGRMGEHRAPRWRWWWWWWWVVGVGGVGGSAVEPGIGEEDTWPVTNAGWSRRIWQDWHRQHTSAASVLPPARPRHSPSPCPYSATKNRLAILPDGPSAVKTTGLPSIANSLYCYLTLFLFLFPVLHCGHECIWSLSYWDLFPEEKSQPHSTRGGWKLKNKWWKLSLGLSNFILCIVAMKNPFLTLSVFWAFKCDRANLMQTETFLVITKLLTFSISDKILSDITDYWITTVIVFLGGDKLLRSVSTKFMSIKNKFWQWWRQFVFSDVRLHLGQTSCLKWRHIALLFPRSFFKQQYHVGESGA